MFKIESKFKRNIRVVCFVNCHLAGLTNVSISFIKINGKGSPRFFQNIKWQDTNTSFSLNINLEFAACVMTSLCEYKFVSPVKPWAKRFFNEIPELFSLHHKHVVNEIFFPREQQSLWTIWNFEKYKIKIISDIFVLFFLL